MVDNLGNLYVADTGNHRILRYPTPFQQYAQSGSVFPDMWVGQPNLSSNGANYGAASGQPCSDPGLNLAASLPVNIALHANPDGTNDLWVVDPGNRRVLEFAGGNLAQAQQSGDFSGLHASLQLGPADFTSNNLAGPTNASTLNVANAFATPVAVAFDASGNLFVSDYSTSYGLGRVLVFAPPFTSKQGAVGIMGIPNGSAPAGQVAMGLPTSMFFIPGSQPSSNMMGVVDSSSSRIMLFNSLDSGQWPASVTTSPTATAVFGQTSYTATGGNGGTSSYIPAPSASTFDRPTAAVYSTSSSELYVADTLNHRVLTLPFAAGAFSAATQVLGQLNFTMSAPNMIEGREFNFFANISGSTADAGVAIDTSSAHLYVSDPNNHRVLGFNDFHSLAAGAKADIVIGQNDFNSGLCNMTGNTAARPPAASAIPPAWRSIPTATSTSPIVPTAASSASPLRSPTRAPGPNPTSSSASTSSTFPLPTPPAPP